MKVKVSKKLPEQYQGDLLVYFVKQGDKKKAPLCNGQMAAKIVEQAHGLGDFMGKEGETLLAYPDKDMKVVVPKAARVLVVGLGKESIERETLRKAGGTIGTIVNKTKSRKIMVVLPGWLELMDKEIGQAIAEGLVMAAYRFDKYKKPKEEDEPQVTVEELVFRADAGQLYRPGAVIGLVHGQAACQARDMANEPSNNWTPEHFADYARQLAEEYGLSHQIFGKKEMEELGMGGILGVNQGSAKEPTMAIVEYKNGVNVPTLLLVGKGLTFDSGGISLKPGAGMEDMKYDMCGGAAVLATMRALAELQPRDMHVVGIVPATDNMPGPTALKPGDVIEMYNGKSVEVINTDAEGRLILADALAYGIEKYEPETVIDLATLTGAVIVSLGHHHSGLLCNDDELATVLAKAGDLAGEPLWRLPLGKEYSKQLESKVADLKNIGGKAAGTITAAAFLQEFVDQDIKWAHLDIAGTAWDFTDKPYIPKGPSGVGVRTLLEFINVWC